MNEQAKEPVEQYTKAPEKRRELKASTRRAYGIKQLVKHLELYMDDHCYRDQYRFSCVTYNSVLVHEFNTHQWAYVYYGRCDKSDINDLIDNIYRKVRRSNVINKPTNEKGE